MELQSKYPEAGIDYFFAGRPFSFALFSLLRKKIERFSSPSLKVGNTQISFGEGKNFLWVWLPQTWIRKRPEKSLTVTIVTPTKPKSRMIEQSVQPKRGCWTSHIIISDKEDINSELIRLIKTSYRYSKNNRNKKKKSASNTRSKLSR